MLDRVANFLGEIFRQIAEFQLRTLVSDGDDDDVTSRVIVDAVVRSHSRADGPSIPITLERAL